MDDEGKWDKEQQHLDDHHQDLLHEEALANCEHEEFGITDIVNLRTHGLRGEVIPNPMLELEIVCKFCGKSNIAEIPSTTLLNHLMKTRRFLGKGLWSGGVLDEEWW